MSRSRAADAAADVCLVVEGAYPYVAGGVSSWLHDLVIAQRHLTFHLLVLSADDAPRKALFDLPANVVGVTEVALQKSERHVPQGHDGEALLRRLEAPLQQLLRRGGRADFAQVLSVLREYRANATRPVLLNSQPAFAMLRRMYDVGVPGSSFLHYFWTWRSLVGGLFSVLLAPLPRARLYHAVSTGYAGLAMARGALESGCPALLTEHGIYSSERRIEIAMANWMTERAPSSLDLNKRTRDLRDIWLDAFLGYSRTCYESCDAIVTLYGANQAAQVRDGAPIDRLEVIPNGIDVASFGAIARKADASVHTVALIGRVVPLKDVKTYIRAVALLREMIPDVRALVLGPTDEDSEYFDECVDMVRHFGLERCVEFTGRVALRDYLGHIDVIALTSLSEAQPLVLLEAGAAGVPSVATDVGSCREIIEGRADESPPLGPGGFVTALGNPRATAQALADLLRDPALRARCGGAMQERTRRYYNKASVDATYRELYARLLAPTQGHAPAGVRA